MGIDLGKVFCEVVALNCSFGKSTTLNSPAIELINKMR